MKKFSEQKEILDQPEAGYLTEEEEIMVNGLYESWVEAGANIEDLNEGFFRKLIGGATGFIVGPTIGKVIARALGISSGPLYSVLTSRLVSTALGAAIADSIKVQKK